VRVHRHYSSCMLILILLRSHPLEAFRQRM
jgi:hypothetical protein